MWMYVLGHDFGRILTCKSSTHDKHGLDINIIQGLENVEVMMKVYLFMSFIKKKTSIKKWNESDSK